MNPRTRPRILIADADASSRAAYRQSFVDCDVIETANGRDALTSALVRVPALVITELSLPVLDGFALCEILRRNRATATLPILVATSATTAADITRAQQVADTVLAKPTTAEVLLTESARLLARSQELRGVLTRMRADAAESVGISATVLRIAAALRQQPELGPHAEVDGHAVARYVTSSPPLAPPALTCATCDRPLVYEVSYVGAVPGPQAEQWDYYACSACGRFQYRQFTRQLRALTADEQRRLDDLDKR